MSQRKVEITVGLLMILGILALIFLALRVSGLSLSTLSNQRYTVSATFDNIGGLNLRAPVRIAGVEVGNVTDIELNPQTFQAVVTMQIENDVNDIPTTSSARISSAGLLGDSYVSITPGYYMNPAHPENLKNGSVIQTTYSATSLESLISTFLGSSGGSSSSGNRKSSPKNSLNGSSL